MEKCAFGKKLNKITGICENCGNNQKSDGLICTSCSSVQKVNNKLDKCLDKCAAGKIKNTAT